MKKQNITQDIKEKEKIIQKILFDDTDNIIEFLLMKQATAFGTGAHIMLPKELIGKKVCVTYVEEKIKKED